MLILPENICPDLNALPGEGIRGSGGVFEAGVGGKSGAAIPGIIADKDIRLICINTLGIVPPEQHQQQLVSKGNRMPGIPTIEQCSLT